MDRTRSWVPELVAVGVFAVAGVWWSDRGNPVLVVAATAVAVALHVWVRPSVRRRAALCTVFLAAAVVAVVPWTRPIPVVADPVSPALWEGTGLNRTSGPVVAVTGDWASRLVLSPTEILVQGRLDQGPGLDHGSDVRRWNWVEPPSAAEVADRFVHDLWDVRPTLMILLGALAVLSVVPVRPRRRRNGRIVGVLVGCAAAMTCGSVVILDDLMAYQEEGVAPIGWLPLRDAALHAVPPVLVIAAAAALVLGGVRRGPVGMRMAGAATLMLIPAFLARGLLAGAGMHPTQPVVLAGTVRLVPMEEPVLSGGSGSFVTFACLLGFGLLIMMCARAADSR